MRLRGLDISAAQGVIDFDRLPPEYVFLVVKVSEGDTYRDPTRIRNIAEAHRTGRVWSAYHFCRPSQDPIRQTLNLWDSIGDTMPDFRPTLDLENGPDDWSPAQLVDWFLRMADEVQRYFAVPPMIYTYPWWAKSKIAPAVPFLMSNRLAACPLWMADYAHGERPPDDARPFVPLPWETWTMWQTSGDNSTLVPGVPGHVDHDVFNGDMDSLRMFCGLPEEKPTDPVMVIHPDLEIDPRKLDE